MRAGTLDRRIIIQDKSEAIDAYGYRTPTWSTFLTVWAKPEQKLGQEKTDDENRSTERMVNFIVRYNSTITNDMRVIWESNYYKIEDIKEFGRQEGMIISTTLLAQT
jgi:SPP1 family predicted phage head-tail adaptor